MVQFFPKSPSRGIILGCRCLSQEPLLPGAELGSRILAGAVVPHWELHHWLEPQVLQPEGGYQDDLAVFHRNLVNNPV